MFDLVSDFHVEMNRGVFEKIDGVTKVTASYDWKSEKKNDILVMAGDTGNTINNTMNTIKEASEYYDRILFVDGNHEHYQKTRYVTDNMKLLAEFADLSRGKIIFLDTKNSYYKDGDTLYIGCNGWYNFSYGDGNFMAQRAAWGMYSNDSRCILFPKTPEDMAAEQADQLKRLVLTAQNDDRIKSIVVVTHTVPVKDGLGVDPYGDSVWNMLNGAYGNSYMQNVIKADTKEKIKVWVFGHTHYKKDFREGHIRFISNPRGYSGENRDGALFDGLKNVIF